MAERRALRFAAIGLLGQRDDESKAATAVQKLLRGWLARRELKKKRRGD